VQKKHSKEEQQISQNTENEFKEENSKELHLDHSFVWS
jgi:hypothetical protein